MPTSEKTCALLTGRLVVVHESVARRLDGEAACRPLDLAPGFSLVDSTSRNAVTVLTELLEEGLINVLVGTRALLGEGWDAPCINSLILASNVGSYMLTNQMRGRAIRIDPNDPDKVSSIWHIVAIVLDRRRFDLRPKDHRLFYPGLADFRELDGRFSTFVGVHQTEPRIENNLFRLELPYIERKRDYVSGAEHLAFKTRFFESGAQLEGTNDEMVSTSASTREAGRSLAGCDRARRCRAGRAERLAEPASNGAAVSPQKNVVLLSARGYLDVHADSIADFSGHAVSDRDCRRCADLVVAEIPVRRKTVLAPSAHRRHGSSNRFSGSGYVVRERDYREFRSATQSEIDDGGWQRFRQLGRRNIS